MVRRESATYPQLEKKAMSRAKKQTRTSQAATPARSPLDDLPFANWPDYLTGLKLLVTPRGQKLEKVMEEHAHCSWARVNTLPWSDAPDIEVAVLSVLSGAFLVPILAMQEPDPYLPVYLGLLKRHGSLNLKRIKEEFFLSLIILRAFGEYQHRVIRHPVGALLPIAVSAEDAPPHLRGEAQAMAERAWEEWSKRVVGSLSLFVAEPQPGQRVGEAIRGDEQLPWLCGILGEPDETVAKEEAVQLIAERLVKVFRGLEAIPYPELVAKAMSGKLNYHKSVAKQAVLRGQRPEHERPPVAQIPPSADADTQEETVRLADVADPVAEHEVFAAATNIDKASLATVVSRKYRLTKAQHRVIEQYLIHPSRPTQKEIAALARVDLTTVKNTLKKIQEDPSKLSDLGLSVP